LGQKSVNNLDGHKKIHQYSNSGVHSGNILSKPPSFHGGRRTRLD
jgi:hypothetical protein